MYTLSKARSISSLVVFPGGLWPLCYPGVELRCLSSCMPVVFYCRNCDLTFRGKFSNSFHFTSVQSNYFPPIITIILLYDSSKTVTVKCLDENLNLKNPLKVFLWTFSWIATPAVNIFVNPLEWTPAIWSLRSPYLPQCYPPLPSPIHQPPPSTHSASTLQPQNAFWERESCEFRLYRLAPICYRSWAPYWAQLLSCLHHFIASAHTYTHPVSCFFTLSLAHYLPQRHT